MDRQLSEQWRPVVGWEATHSVSNMGRVRREARIIRNGPSSTAFFPQRILRGNLSSTTGYMVVTLSHNGRRLNIANHILVLEAFVSLRPDGMEACHNNGKRDDPRLENLRWDTHVNNCADKQVHGTAPFGERHHAAKLTWEAVEKIRTERRLDREWAAEFGVASDAIRKIRVGLRWPSAARN